MVGFVGPEDEVCVLINRILDSSVFGDKDLQLDCSKGVEGWEGWFRHRSIRYYHESDRGIVFLQFYSAPVVQSWSGGDDGLDCDLEQHDSDDLRGLLLMFSVSFSLY